MEGVGRAAFKLADGWRPFGEPFGEFVVTPLWTLCATLVNIYVGPGYIMAGCGMFGAALG